tara:strand:+ start:11689 stop:12525 length:837 start_codon:yes stop_codon:yes gene_type:complete
MEEIVSNMLKNYGDRILRVLSEKYKIEYEEMRESVGIEKLEVRVEGRGSRSSKVSKVSKVPMPFVGEMCEEKCNGIKLNHGLYTQCEREGKINYKEYKVCEGCMKDIEKNGEPKYGYIQERVEKGEDYRCPKGKKVIKYGNVIEKLKIKREDVEKEAKRLGIKIDEKEFEVEKIKRGRPAKRETAVLDSSSEEGDVVKRGRGRPKKEKKSVISESKIEMSEVVEEREDEEEEEVELAVSEFIIKGKKYLKAGDNTLYDLDTHDEVGMWNPTNKNIEVC